MASPGRRPSDSRVSRARPKNLLWQPRGFSHGRLRRNDEHGERPHARFAKPSVPRAATLLTATGGADKSLRARRWLHGTGDRPMGGRNAAVDAGLLAVDRFCAFPCGFRRLQGLKLRIGGGNEAIITPAAAGCEKKEGKDRSARAHRGRCIAAL